MKRKGEPATLPLSPALTFLLMTGRQAAPRVPGWVRLAQQVVSAADYASVRRDYWPTAAAALEAEAVGFEFTPWGKSGRRPTGAGVETWARQYLATHTY